jgi:dolichol-phosphate mannosyltransferase
MPTSLDGLGAYLGIHASIGLVNAVAVLAKIQRVRRRHHAAMNTLSLVIPCYNEERTLEICISRVLQLSSTDLRLQVIIVDDCSKDRSPDIAQELAKQHPQIILFLQHEKNQGKGAALRTGFANATGDYVGVQDADLEYDPLQYRVLLNAMQENQADVVFGSRYLQTDNRRVLYFWHTWMNRALTTLTNMLTNLDITDMETCYKLFRREIIQSIDLRENRFGFEPEVTAKIAQTRCRVYECAIRYTPRTPEEGKKINWKDGVWAIYCILHYGGSTAPLPIQLFIYLFIGAICATVNVVSFGLLLRGGAEFEAAVVSAFIVSAALNYLLCITFLFERKTRWSGAGEIFVYTLVVSVVGLLDYAITVQLAAAGLDTIMSKFLAATMGFLLNFLLRRYLVFPKRPAVRM